VDCVDIVAGWLLGFKLVETEMKCVWGLRELRRWVRWIGEDSKTRKKGGGSAR
jgi:hypothetical protein